ncbi:bifunctional DNA primase/polymerase [Kutzneria viridogrisea]|uniref:Primase-polymerase (Primpol)-like protein n=1 Tax=Kutzneria viridogrisea TaxID=47990 RepID=A0ABR6BGA8_9PSEU|nr:primase-polymerase (primpol)-like protein [Kutzneria viridogrisea]
MAVLVCEQCDRPLPIMSRKGTRFCGSTCRSRVHRAQRAAAAAEHQRELPAELTELRRWITHTPGRVPLTSSGRLASATDPATWGKFADVAQLDRRGFVLTAGDGIVCVDLDHCLSGGVLAPWAAEILAHCPRTYVEVSASGTGLHIWGRGRVLSGRRIRRGGRHIEVYGHARYIAVTGNRFRRSPSSLADLSGLVPELLAAC